ncbi:hypothetical protein Tco_1029850 [Tanacetum coccineum]|uniref:Uncharacterized protein n=1 Tax=Tanacetum coccineum TaxID=301880 RepID=A0ABQ5G6A5_9ASTR
MPIPNVADEAVFKEWDDRVAIATTTAASLDAAQASGNITKTQSMAMSNDPLSQEIRVNTPRSDEERLEQHELMDNVPSTLHDLPLLGGHTPRSDEGRLQQEKLTDIVTTLSQKAEGLESDLKKTNKLYTPDFKKLINRVKSLEDELKFQKSESKRRRLTLVTSEDEEDLVAEDPSKQGRSLIDEMDLDAGISLVSLHVEVQGRSVQKGSTQSESHSHVYENKSFKQNSSLDNENRCLKKSITELSKQAADVKEEMTKRCAQYEKDFAKLEAHFISLKSKLQNQSLTSMQKGHVLNEQSDDVTIKFDFDKLDMKNIELEHVVASLQKNEHLKLTYQNLFDSIKRLRVQKKSSNVSQNEEENLKPRLSEFADKKFDKVFQKIESMKKKKFDSRISNDFLQKYLYDSNPLNVESKSGEKNIIFRNETSSFEIMIKELEMTLAQQTKNFKDAKIQDSKAEKDQFLDCKIQDSKAKKDQFLKQIASLESKLASQDLLSIKKEYSDLRTSYNALKEKFDSLNWDKGKSPVLNFPKPTASVSKKIYKGESFKSFPKRVSYFTTYSLQKDRKFSKKPQAFETPTP